MRAAGRGGQSKNLAGGILRCLPQSPAATPFRPGRAAMGGGARLPLFPPLRSCPVGAAHAVACGRKQLWKAKTLAPQPS